MTTNLENLENLEYLGISMNIENSGKQNSFNWIKYLQTQQGVGLQMNKVLWISEMVAVRWWPCYIAGLDVEWLLTYDGHYYIYFFCDNLWKSVIYGSGKSMETQRIFLSYFVVTLTSLEGNGGD